MSDWWDYVVCASTAVEGNINLASAPSSIDGISLSSGDRVLLKHQTTSSQNRTYTYASGVLTAVSGDIPAPRATVRVDRGTANGKTTWALVDTTSNAWALQSFVVNVQDFGARGDGRTVHDASVSAGSTTLTSASAAFPSSFSGVPILVFGAGLNGGDLVTTATYASSTTVTLGTAATTTVSAAQIIWGTDDSAAIALALTEASQVGAAVGFPPGLYVSKATTVTAPANVRFTLEEGAMLAPFGQTITLNGRLSAHPTQAVFTGTGVPATTVTQTGTGPTMSTLPTGNPRGTFHIVLQIAAAGVLGTMTFAYSLDGGGTYSTAVASAAGGSYAFAIPGTGVTATFASGTYVKGTTYAFTSTPTVVLTALATDRFSLRWWGAAGDGTTDDTAAVQTALNAAAAAHGTAYVPVGTYLSGPLYLTRAYGMTLEGERSQYGGSGTSTGSIFKWHGGTGTFLTLTDCQDIQTRSLHFYGTNNQVDVCNTAVAVVSNNDPASYYVSFDRCIFSEWGTCVTWATNPFQADKGGLLDCEFWFFTRYGVYVSSANALDAGRIEGCIFVGALGPESVVTAVGIYLFWTGFVTVTNCLGGGELLYLLQINASLANNVTVTNCESEMPSGSYMIYISGANDANTYTLIGNSMTAPVYVGGTCRVVGIGNNYFFPLYLDGAGVKYVATMDRFNAQAVPAGTNVVVLSGGLYCNQDLIHAATFDELWSAGQITWQPSNPVLGGPAGTAGEQCIRSGRRCLYWHPSTPYPTGSYVAPPVDNGHVYINNGGTGTSGTSVPAFNTGSGSTTTDGTVTWTEAGAAALFQNFAPLNHLTGTTAPTSGYFTQGAVCWNTAPTSNPSVAGASGSFAGWVCVASGNPGTWIPFGTMVPPYTTITVTSGSPSVPFGYIRFPPSTTLTGAMTIALAATGTFGSEWIIDATNVTLAGHTITAQLNGINWATTIGTSSIYKLYEGGTGQIYGVALTP